MGAENGLRIVKYGDWNKAAAILGKGMRPVFQAWGKAVEQEGKFLKRRLVEGIRGQAPGGRKFKPLAPTTLAVRKFLGFKSNKALMVTRELLKSIDLTKIGRRGSKDFQLFVGIYKSAMRTNGKSLMEIMRIQEYGKVITIRVTPKMMRFFFAAMRSKSRRKWMGSREHLAGRSTGVITVRIPPRPVFQPIWAAWGPSSRGRVAMIMEKELKGEYSK